jgi:hypothetical protein
MTCSLPTLVITRTPTPRLGAPEGITQPYHLYIEGLVPSSWPRRTRPPPDHFFIIPQAHHMSNILPIRSSRGPYTGFTSRALSQPLSWGMPGLRNQQRAYPAFNERLELFTELFHSWKRVQS